MENEEIQKLKSRIEKDSKTSAFRISEVQKSIQSTVALRKELKAEFEQRDAELESEINDYIREVNEIQGRLLQAQDLLRYMESNEQ